MNVRTGYSILLGETLQAETVQYRDCERFQIVCPHCREPIFKVRRVNDEGDLHYLAHYASARAYQGECDLRVAQLDRQLLEQQNHLSREQRLAYFLGVLRRTLAMSPMYVDPAEKIHWRLDHAPGIVHIRDLAWSALATEPIAVFEDASGDYLYRLEDSGWEIATSFSLERQKQIARDMWLTVTSGNGRSNFDYLFNHGLISDMAGWTSMENPSPLESAVTAEMASHVMALLKVRKSGLNQVLDRMMSSLLPARFNVERGVNTGERSTYFSRLLGNVATEMIGHCSACHILNCSSSSLETRPKSTPMNRASTLLIRMRLHGLSDCVAKSRSRGPTTEHRCAEAAGVRLDTARPSHRCFSVHLTARAPGNFSAEGVSSGGNSKPAPLGAPFHASPCAESAMRI
ncbi:TPA: hypothetical protein ACYLN4_007559 [Burkholderia lata]